MTVPQHLQKYAHIERLIVRRIASMDEILSCYDLEDVVIKNQWLDMMDDAEYLANEQANRSGK